MIPLVPISMLAYMLLQWSWQASAIPKAPVAVADNVGIIILFRLVLVALMIGILYELSWRWLIPQLMSLGVCILLSNPWWTTRNILIPLRLPRAAYQLMCTGYRPLVYAKPDGPVLAASWCLSRMKSPIPGSIDRVEGRLKIRQKLQASTVAAHAMLAAARGQLDEARMLFASVPLFAVSGVSSEMSRVCFEWLATDAAARGDWESVERLAGHSRAPRVPTLALLGDIARRPHGARNAPAIEVWAARLTIRKPDAATSAYITHDAGTRTATPIVENTDKLSVALSRSLENTRNSPAELAAFATLWQEALSDETLRHRLSARSADIGGGDVTATLDSLRRLIESDLVARINEVHELSIDGIPRGPLMNSALAKRRDRIFSEISERVHRLQDRQRENRMGSTLDEWREFIAIHRAYLNVIAAGSKGDRSLAFSIAGFPLNAFAIWLHSERQESAVAHAVFRFLEMEARLTGSASYNVIRGNAAQTK